MGTEFGKLGKATKNGDSIQWANGEMFKIGQGLLRLSGQNTWQTLRPASPWLTLQSDPKEGFCAPAACVSLMHLGSGVRCLGSNTYRLSGLG